MANLRDIRNRIRSVKSTQKITRAMKMVAAARLRRSQEAVEEARPYARKLGELLNDLAQNAPEGLHPLLGGRPVEKRIVVLLTSDRGLCGAFNASLIRQAMQETVSEIPTQLLTIGRKGISFFGKRQGKVLQSVGEFWKGFTYEKSATLVDDLAASYLKGQFDRVDLLYNEFISVITQRPKLVPILPIVSETQEGENETSYIYEPSRNEILKAVVPEAIRVRFYHGCLNSLASEHGARMTAMDSATRNAGEMIDRLTLKMNRERQASITRELVEIISGAEALNA